MAEEPEVLAPTKEISTELSYHRWLEKITERCTLSLLCIKDRVDKIQESDWEILRALHGVWYNGEVALYRTITIPDTTKSTQQSLFTDNPTEAPINFDDARDKILNGTDFVKSEVNQNNN